MSRVRILNLPRDCTEEKLRRHILTSLPPSAPHIEITDCSIKRAPSHRTYNNNNNNNNNNNTIIRMAFVGFRNSSSGHFVVRHFDGAYFGSAKLRVEIAKGIGEVGITTNMRKKLEGAQQVNSNNNNSNNNNNNNGNEDVVRKRERSELETRQGVANSHNTSRLNEDNNNENNNENENDDKEKQERRKKERKEEFITERTKTTSGPTWAAEVLLPDSNDININTVMKSNEKEGVSYRETHTLLDNNNNNNNKEEEEEVNEEEAERRALERQQELGKVSDMDFLASLANKTSPTKITEIRNKSLETEDEFPPTYNNNNNDAQEDIDNVENPHVINSTNTTLESSNNNNNNNEEDIVRESRRVRLGNIPFIATEDDVKQYAASLVGPVEAVHIPLTKDTRQSKGAAFVKFINIQDAIRALTLCKGSVFMGRLLRVSAAEDDPYTKKLEENNSNNNINSSGIGNAGNSIFKQQRQQERKGEAGAGMSWNTMYINSHAAVETIAKRLGVTSENVVSVQARGAAVRAAIAEACLTSEVRQVLSDEGIDFTLIESAQQNLLKKRSNTTILVKNIKADNAEDAGELSKLFLKYGALETTAFPSAGTFALFRFVHPQDARVAFQRLSYKLFKTSPLFLEWAPIGAIVDNDNDNEENNKSNNNKDGDSDLPSDKPAFAPVLTLFITNIPFTSTEDEFYVFLLDTCSRLAKTPEKYIERLAFEQDKGRAFLTLREQNIFTYILQRLNGRSFAGRTLACVPSKQTASALTSNKISSNISTQIGNNNNNNNDDELAKVSTIVARRGSMAHHTGNIPPGSDPLKLVVKNVPFEATERDIRELFSAFSEIRSVRLPRKSHQFTTHRENNHRGFAFVEFLSEEEARRAMETLKSTHLYGRHLVLQYAKLDER